MDNQNQNRITQAVVAVTAGLIYLARFIQAGGQPELEKRLGGQWLLVLGVGMIIFAGLGVTPIIDGFELEYASAALIGGAGFGLIIKNDRDDNKALETQKEVKITQGAVG